MDEKPPVRMQLGIYSFKFSYLQNGGILADSYGFADGRLPVSAGKRGEFLPGIPYSS
jgi:hypothetical protein